MPFPTSENKNRVAGAETIAICLILTCSLQIMENLLPKIPIFPWLRLGLAYWVLLPFLIRFGVGQTLLLFFFRNLITLLYGGQIFSAFLISSSAGLLTIATTGFAARHLFQRGLVGLIGYSVLMAVTFNVLQLFVVNQLLIQHVDFYFQLSPILFWSAVSGTLIALLVAGSRRSLETLFATELTLSSRPGSQSRAPLPFRIPAAVAIGVMLFVLILVVEMKAFQAGLIVVLLLMNRFRNLKVLFYAWPFYFYIAFLHLFRTEGVYLLGEWVTREGLDAFLYYAARTTNIILCGQWIGGFVPMLVQRWPTNRFVTGVSYALPMMPAIFGISIALGKDLLKRIARRDFDNLLDPIVQKLLETFQKLADQPPPAFTSRA